VQAIKKADEEARDMRRAERKRREDYRKKLDALQKQNHDTIEELKKDVMSEMKGDEANLQKLKNKYYESEEGKQMSYLDKELQHLQKQKEDLEEHKI
jgi:hypothetical protein